MLERTRRAQEAGELGAVDFAEGAAHEASLLRGNEHRRPLQAATADDDTVVELLRQVEDRKMRADLAQLGADVFGKAAGIDQRVDALPGARLVPAQRSRVGCRLCHRSGSSILRTPCARRSATVSGRAPPSLMEMRKPPAERRATKSRTTASHTAPKP
ncbi:hypothetical protein ABIF50_003048 [Bradyrhizobium diazoefficiens]